MFAILTFAITIVDIFIVDILTVHPVMELGGRVVRVLDSGQLHQSERSWVRFLDGPLKNCQASGQSRGHVSSGWTRKNTID